MSTRLRPKANGTNRKSQYTCTMLHKHKPFIQAISIAPLAVHYYSEALPTQHGYCVGGSRRSATISCERRTSPTHLQLAARAGFEPATNRTKGVESTNEPPRPTLSAII